MNSDEIKIVIKDQIELTNQRRANGSVYHCVSGQFLPEL